MTTENEPEDKLPKPAHKNGIAEAARKALAARPTPDNRYEVVIERKDIRLGFPEGPEPSAPDAPQQTAGAKWKSNGKI